MTAPQRPGGVVALTPRCEDRPWVGIAGSLSHEPGEPHVTVNFWLGGRVSGIGVKMTPSEARSLGAQLVAFADRAEGTS